MSRAIKKEEAGKHPPSNVHCIACTTAFITSLPSRPPESAVAAPHCLAGNGFKFRHDECKLKTVFTIFLVYVESCFCGQCTDVSAISDADRVAHWIVAQQYTNSNFASYGGIKMSPDPVVYGTDREPYYCVCAYYANLAVLSLLRTGAPDGKRVADLWINWYLGQLNLLCHQTEKVRTFVQATKRFKFRGADGFAGPFNVEDAGWMLQVLTGMTQLKV